MYHGKPVIGLTASFRPDDWTPQHYLNESYFHAIRQFGGIPLLIPVLAEQDELEYLISSIDGLVLTGGDDLNPELFGEKILNDTVTLCQERDRAEYAALNLVAAQEIPILGICRGIQVMNVYFGGTLYQDILTQIVSDIQHRMEPPYHRTSHSCVVTPGSPLHELVKQGRISVNSHHHQSVKHPAPGFLVTARSDDGVIEAICDPTKPFRWGVQWHPERIWDLEPSSAKLFEAFIGACKK